MAGHGYPFESHSIENLYSWTLFLSRAVTSVVLISFGDNSSSFQSKHRGQSVFCHEDWFGSNLPPSFITVLFLNQIELMMMKKHYYGGKVAFLFIIGLDAVMMDTAASLGAMNFSSLIVIPSMSYMQMIYLVFSYLRVLDLCASFYCDYTPMPRTFVSYKTPK